MAKHIQSYKTPFYVRTRFAQASFADHETKLNVHGDHIVKVNVVGVETAKWLKAGGLVVCTPAEIAKAKAEGKVKAEDAFTRTTKIIMIDSKDSHGKPVKMPKEVPLTDEDNPDFVPEEEDIDDDGEESDDDDQDGEEGEQDDDEEENDGAGDGGLDSILDAAGDDRTDAEKAKDAKKAEAKAKKAAAKAAAQQ